MEIELFKCQAQLVYELDRSGFVTRCVAQIPTDISNYYYSMISKKYACQRPKYKPHVTIVRPKFERVWASDPKLFSQYKTLSLDYQHQVKLTGSRFVLDVWSEEIGLLRSRLGLPEYRHGFDRYHITIARTNPWPYDSSPHVTCSHGEVTTWRFVKDGEMRL